MNSNTNIRLIGAGFISLILLYTFVSFIFTQSIENNESINLLEAPIQGIYGSHEASQNDFKIELDEYGVALVLFEVPSFESQSYSKFAFNIKNLPLNYQTKLVFLTNEQPQPYELALLQPNGRTQSNILSLYNEWKGKVKMIGLRISPQNDLGLSVSNHESIEIIEANLNNTGFVNNYFTLLNYWLDYNPLDYFSISHLKLNDLLPYYAQPLIFILLWLLIYSFCFLTKIGIKAFLLVFFISWLFLDTLFIKNLYFNNKWASKHYALGQKAFSDDQIVEISKQILFYVEKDKINLSQNKLVIYGPSQFHGLRLVYHLLPFNVGFIGNKLVNHSYKKRDYILQLSLNKELNFPISGKLIAEKNIVTVEKVAQNTKFLLMRVIE